MPRGWNITRSRSTQTAEAVGKETSQDPHVCARCAQAGPTCCRLVPGQEEFCFPVSVMEWERILEHAGDRGSFVQEANSARFVSGMKQLFPGEDRLVEELFSRHKFHLRLATRKDGGCIFLGARGCRLPREARPYYCRVFPFWVYGERMALFTPATCLAVREGLSEHGVLNLMGMTGTEVSMLHGRLRLAWGLPPRPDMRFLKQSFRRYQQ